MCIRDRHREGSVSKSLPLILFSSDYQIYILCLLYTSRGWKTEEINGIEFELNSILVEKWKGKAYRLVMQRQKRMDGVLDLWEVEYTYRCILTNDYESSTREIVEFYNLRGGKERIFPSATHSIFHNATR